MCSASPLARADNRTPVVGVAAALPYYCMPERIIALAQLPLTDRGKIDKRLLLQMAQDANTVVSCGTPDTADVSP